MYWYTALAEKQIENELNRCQVTEEPIRKWFLTTFVTWLKTSGPRLEVALIDGKLTWLLNLTLGYYPPNDTLPEFNSLPRAAQIELEQGGNIAILYNVQGYVKAYLGQFGPFMMFLLDERADLSMYDFDSMRRAQHAWKTLKERQEAHRQAALGTHVLHIASDGAEIVALTTEYALASAGYDLLNCLRYNSAMYSTKIGRGTSYIAVKRHGRVSSLAQYVIYDVEGDLDRPEDSGVYVRYLSHLAASNAEPSKEDVAALREWARTITNRVDSTDSIYSVLHSSKYVEKSYMNTDAGELILVSGIETDNRKLFKLRRDTLFRFLRRGNPDYTEQRPERLSGDDGFAAWRDRYVNMIYAYLDCRGNDQAATYRTLYGIGSRRDANNRMFLEGVGVNRGRSMLTGMLGTMYGYSIVCDSYASFDQSSVRTPDSHFAQETAPEVRQGRNLRRELAARTKKTYWPKLATVSKTQYKSPFPAPVLILPAVNPYKDHPKHIREHLARQASPTGRVIPTGSWLTYEQAQSRLHRPAQLTTPFHIVFDECDRYDTLNRVRELTRLAVPMPERLIISTPTRR